MSVPGKRTNPELEAAFGPVAEPEVPAGIDSTGGIAGMKMMITSKWICFKI